MQCPGCHTTVVSADAFCPRCGLDLGLLHLVTECKQTLHRTKGEAIGIAHHLQALEQRLVSLEEAVTSRLTAGVGSGPTAEKGGGDETAAPTEPPSAPPVPPHAVPLSPPPRRRKPVDRTRMEVRFGQRALLIVGVALTVLGVGYFLKYSFDRNWIPPWGRVALAYAAAAALMGCGEFFRRRKYLVFGLYLLGGGVAVLYFASYAAFEIYGLIDQVVAFSLMVVVTVFAVALAVRHDTKWLAVLGIIGGYLTPVVLRTETDNQIALMTYMAILSFGIVAVAAFKRWNLLSHLGMTLTWLLFAAWYSEHYVDAKFLTTAVFLNLFFVCYALVPFVYHFVRGRGEDVKGFGLTIPNAFVAFAFSYATIEAHFSARHVGIATTAYALLFMATAGFLRLRNRENVNAFVLLFATGLLFLTITVPIVFSEHWITVFWAVQGGILLWAGLRVGHEKLCYVAVALLIVAVGKFVGYDYEENFRFVPRDFSFRAGYTGHLTERLMTTVVNLAMLFFAARAASRAGGEGRPAWTRQLAGLFAVLFGALLFVSLNVETAAWFHDYAPRARFASVSVLWTLFAVGLMALGFARRRAVLRGCALALFACTLAKVFLRDMANVDTPYRILSFLVLGVVLVAASFLYHRFKERIEPPVPGDEGISNTGS